MQISTMKPLAAALRGAGPLRSLRGWDRLLRLLFNPDRQRRSELRFQLFGRPYRGDTASFVDWSAWFYGAYEAQQLALVRPILAAMDAPVILDVGANVGHHSRFFAQYGSVHAFEPNPDLADRLTETVAGLPVTVHRTGLGSLDADRSFALPPGRNDGMGTFEPRPGWRTVDLPVRRGDGYLRLDRLDFVKIDVEGHEAAVLAGLAETIRRYRPVLWVEVSGREQDVLRLLDGYRILAFQKCGGLTTAMRLAEVEEVPSGPVDVLCIPVGKEVDRPQDA